MMTLTVLIIFVGGIDSSHDMTHPGLTGTDINNDDNQAGLAKAKAQAIKVSDQIK